MRSHHRRWSRRTATIVIVSVLTLLLIAGATAGVERLLRAPIAEGETITILLLGSDEGPMRSSDPLRGRADAFHLLAVSPDRDRVTFVDFPRDSRVSVPGRGQTRINACLTGGPENCLATIQANWGFTPDHYLVTEFNGLKQAIQRFGGLEIDVQHTVRDGGSRIDQTGVQRITGSQALSYSRDRKNRPGGDFARSAAQTRILRAGHQKLWDGGMSPAQVARTVAILQQTTVTDLSASQLLRLGFLAATIAPDQVEQATLSGSSAMFGGASMVRLHDSAHGIIRSVGEDGRLPG